MPGLVPGLSRNLRIEYGVPIMPREGVAYGEYISSSKVKYSETGKYENPAYELQWKIEADLRKSKDVLCVGK